MASLVRRFALLAALAGMILLADTPSAHATFTLTLSESGFASQTFTGVSTINTGFVSYGTYGIQADLATSNSTTGANPPTVTINNISIQGLSGSTGTPLTITVQDTGFSGAILANTANLVSQLSTTSLTGSGSSVSFHSFVDAFTGGTLTLTTAPAGAGPLSNLVNVALGSTFTLGDTTTVALSAGGLLQSTGTTQLTGGTHPTIVPELDPGSTASGLTLVSGSLLMLFGRRRRACA
jgi:hypothetical protein